MGRPPPLLDRAIISATSRLPDNWLGLRLAIWLRRLTTMRLPGDSGWMSNVSVSDRLHPRRNGCEKDCSSRHKYEARELAALAARRQGQVCVSSLRVRRYRGECRAVLLVRRIPHRSRRYHPRHRAGAENIRGCGSISLRSASPDPRDRSRVGEHAGTVMLDVDPRDREARGRNSAGRSAAVRSTVRGMPDAVAGPRAERSTSSMH